MCKQVAIGNVVYEHVADSSNPVELADQLQSLEPTTLKAYPIAVLSNPNGGFDIYSASKFVRR